MEKPSTSKSHQNRKEEHLAICLNQDPEAQGISTGFENYRFIHEALPEIDFSEIDIKSRFLGYTIAAPFLISPLTGGFEEGARINRLLAEAAQEAGVAIGVGSQRIALLNQELASTFQIRPQAPDVPILANLGAVQLNYGFGHEECRIAVEMIDADALVLHLNPLQEVIQPGGNTNFSGLVKKIEAVCRCLDVPVIVKEVGQGISQRTAHLLQEAGVNFIDTAGAGGTSWPRVEALRDNNGRSEVGETFTDWGIPTAQSIKSCREGAPGIGLIASGGLRSGLEAAKAIALGADLAGFGLPILREAAKGVESVVHRLSIYKDELRTAMFSTGKRSLEELKLTDSLIELS